MCSAIVFLKIPISMSPFEWLNWRGWWSRSLKGIMHIRDVHVLNALNLNMSHFDESPVMTAILHELLQQLGPVALGVGGVCVNMWSSNFYTLWGIDSLTQATHINSSQLKEFNFSSQMHIVHIILKTFVVAYRHRAAQYIVKLSMSQYQHVR